MATRQMNPSPGVSCRARKRQVHYAEAQPARRMPWPTFDQSYIDRLVAGDPETEQHFSDYFGQLVQVKLRAQVRSPQLRDDIRQETFLRVYAFLQKNKTLDHPERLGAFVHTVCHNVIMEHFRSESRTGEMPEHLDPPDSSADSESKLVTAERKEHVRQVLAAMPEKDRALLRSVFLEERDKDEICRELNVDREYLRVLLHRARARFREVMNKGKAATASLLFQ